MADEWPGKSTRPQQARAAESSVEAAATIAPGKRTLTGDLAMASEVGALERAAGPSAAEAKPPGLALPRLDLAGSKESSAGATHSTLPGRVAEATDEEPDAVIKVVAYAKGAILGKPWGAKGRWVGPLPQRYTGTRSATGWTWDNPGAKTVRIGTDLHGRGGRTAEAWAGASADKLVIYATALDAVTSDDQAEQDDHAPGHATGERDAGDGPARSVRPADQRSGAGEAAQGRDHDGPGVPGGAKLVDDFERELGLDPIGEDGEGAGDGQDGAPSATTGDEVEPARVRTGADTRVGGTGPGGERARADGDGNGSEDGGRGGSKGGSRDGTQGGDADGMYGGEGKSGDGGVPSAVALFGGLISVPAALRGSVELALIVSSGDVTGAGGALFKKGLGKLASAAAARSMLAHEARVVAMKETERAIERLATDAKTARAWAKATAAEQQQATRIIYWELQRKYFNGYLAAARRAKAEARAALREASMASSARQRLEMAELAEEAASAPPVAGRLPQNHEFAGKQFPADRLPPAYRQTGLHFSEAGYPDFSPYAQTLPNGQKFVQIAYTGSRSGDFAAANAKAGYKEMPRGFTWHHHEDGKTMLLVPDDLHYFIKHTGGVATYKHTSGVESYGK